MPRAEDLIAALRLQPLPLEGGYYRETYRSPAALPGRLSTDKSAATAIYYLLTPDTFSALHRLPGDGIFHFYAGSAIEMLLLLPDGAGRVIELGSDVLAGQHPQVVVPAGAWQGSRLKSGGDFALLGTTMAPGFDFADYEPGNRDRLTAQYPAFSDLIQRLTRD